VLNRYLDRATVAAQRNEAVALRLNEVLAMVRRPESLLAPRFVLRVLHGTRRRPTERAHATATPAREAADRVSLR
jgi:hypothetical protein